MTDQGKIIYDILCSDEQPPEGQHWEGFVTNKIIAALAQPEPWVKTYSGGKPNYTEPKEWVGLTDDELMELVAFTHMTMENALSVEAKLKEKNAC